MLVTDCRYQRHETKLNRSRRVNENDRTYGEAQYARLCAPLSVCLQGVQGAEVLLARKYVPVPVRAVNRWKRNESDSAYYIVDMMELIALGPVLLTSRSTRKSHTH
jgi:hypothetical protein